ncbi:MAG: phosphatase PAP2 family protein [Chitinophagaceae bacterium]|nr:phosphatase PAP2 family protein [Oligoflexus sp.]
MRHFVSKILCLSNVLISTLLFRSAPLIADQVHAVTPALEPVSYLKKASLWETFKNFPDDYYSFLKNVTDYDASTYLWVGGTTLALLPFDQRITDGSKDFATRNRIMDPKRPEYRSVAKYSLLSTRGVLEIPRTFQGWTWYFGDGMFSLEVAGLFAAYGWGLDDNRATHVSTQIVESLVITGPSVLAIKVMTGRESPKKSTTLGGRWYGYPGILPYSRDQSRYYSFPSGHTATAVSTLTVITENYLEDCWVAPLGDVMVGLLMFSLVNVGSHWPSDFPLAVLIGYTSGHTVVQNDRARDKALRQQDAGLNAPSVGFAWRGFTPAYSDNKMGLQSEWTF